MKKFLIIFLVLFATTAFAQENKPVDSVEFCTVKYKVPKDGVAKFPTEIKGDNYRMIWLYMKPELFKTLPEQFIGQLGAQMSEFNKVPVTVYLLNKQATGYKISFKKDNELHHQIIAYGVVNGQPVLVQLSLNTEPKTNNDIPEFPRQIVSLTN
jgi:hypothetical protein